MCVPGPISYMYGRIGHFFRPFVALWQALSPENGHYGVPRTLANILLVSVIENANN